MNLIVTESGKFADARFTAEGARRAVVAPQALQTVWINTGTLCNLACENCYIESSPSNDRLSYISRAEVQAYLEEIARLDLPVQEIGITGGEPFMNPHILDIMADCLNAGLRLLVLTNAMRPMMKCAKGLIALREQYGEQLALRVSVDHFSKTLHEEERGRRSWAPTMQGLRWLAAEGFSISVAARARWGEDEPTMRAGFRHLFGEMAVDIDAQDPQALVVFPEMDESADVPEITVDCWEILGVHPTQLMCANSRMIVRRREAAAPEVVACTLLPYDPRFSLGSTLRDSLQPVALNHPHCARFCVLGGGSCSG